jgi:hypothetical protein
MARRTRYDNEHDEPSRSRRRPSKNGPPILLIVGLVILMGGAVAVARMAAKNKPEKAEPKPEVQASEIFGDLPIEEPPNMPAGNGSKKLVNTAPAGLADNPDFLRARGIALEAAKKLEEAKKAKSAGDHGQWNIKAGESKELYDQAIIITAVWEEELLELYGDRDRQVKAIMNERSKWIDMLRTLHKTSGR